MTRAELLAVECPRCDVAVGVACVMLSGKNAGEPLLDRYGHARFHQERRTLVHRRILAAEAKQEQLDDKYPEHAKLRRIEPESQKLGEFLEWLQQKYTLCVVMP